jgi:hypothetical protein
MAFGTIEAALGAIEAAFGAIDCGLDGGDSLLFPALAGLFGGGALEALLGGALEGLAGGAFEALAGGALEGLGGAFDGVDLAAFVAPFLGAADFGLLFAVVFDFSLAAAMSPS